MKGPWETRSARGTFEWVRWASQIFTPGKCEKKKFLGASVYHSNGLEERMQNKLKSIQDDLVFLCRSLCNKIPMCIVWSGKPSPG